MISDSSLQANSKALLELGFIPTLKENEFSHPNFNDLVEVYLSRAGHYCVEIKNGGFMAPIVWNGPRANWDTETDEDLKKDFMTYMS